jgi:hypothetical protein
MELAVTDPRSNETKHFYSADFGHRTMERTRGGAYQPFAPIPFTGHSSRTESVLFYTRGEQERPEQLFGNSGPTALLARGGGHRQRRVARSSVAAVPTDSDLRARTSQL